MLVRVSATPSADVTGASSLCLSEARGIVYSVPAGIAGTQYSWSISPASSGSITSGAASRQVTIDWKQRGTSTLTASVVGPTGCRRDSSVTITIQDSLRPTITSATGFAMCTGDSLRLDAGSGYQSYAWFEGSSSTPTPVGTSRFITTKKSATYTVRVSNGSCSGSSAAVTTVVNALPTATIAESPAGTLTATTNAGQAAYQWYDASSTPWSPLTGATQSTYAPSTSGSYGVEVTNTSTGCIKRSTAYVITIGPPPTDPVITSLTPSTTVCSGQVVTLRVRTAGGKTPYVYQWTNGGVALPAADTVAAFAPTSASAQTLTVACIVTDADGKRDTATMTVTVTPLPVAGITENVPATLTAQPSAADSYQWLNASKTPLAAATQSTYQPSASGTYYVVVTQQGCIDTSDAFVYTVAPPPQLLVVSDYDFGSLPVDDLINASGGHLGSVRVHNRTGGYLELTGATADDTTTFAVPQQWPRRMNDGDTAEIAVRFLPTQKQAYTTQLQVRTNTTYSGASTLRGTGRDLLPDERVTQVVLRPSRSEIEPGDTISVLLMVSIERPVQTAGAAGRYVSMIQWDYRVLEPLPSPGMGYDTTGTYAVATLASGMRQQNQVQLYRFRFRAKQAEVDTTTIMFTGAQGFVWQDDRKAYPALVDSVVRVRVCRDGGPQLVGRMLPAQIVRATPSPARDAVDIELNLGGSGTSAGTIDVMSADGRRVISRAVNHDTKHLRLDLTGLSAGIYTVVLTTPTTSDHVTMIVVP